MSKSLNQAFIKAYSKEKARAPAQPSLASQRVYGNDDLIVRFDTATCGPIAAAHTKSANKSKETVGSAVVSPLPRKAVSTRPTAVVRPARDQAARTPISQMPASQLPAELEGRQRDDGDALRGAIAAQMSRAGAWDEQTRQAVLSSNRDALRDQQVNTAGSKELEAPKLLSPALLPQQDSGPSEFFRLDRPSYVRAPAPLDDSPFDDSGELSSEMLGQSSSHFDFKSYSETPAIPLPQESRQSTRAEQTQVVERELRRSKLRVFNPVWEVDSFQWPNICLELLEKSAESLDVVARNLNDAVQEGLKVLAITSPQGGEGRTTVACCLAKLAGSHGLNVAIVDGDIENPTLSYQTNLDVENDWKTAILNQLPLEDIAVHSIDDQVTLVPLIGPIDQSEIAAGDNRIEFMLHELSESFDLVIVDMGHMSSPRSLVNSLGARGVISAVVAVVDHRTADAQHIDHCLRRIRQSGVASIGVVENFAA